MRARRFKYYLLKQGQLNAIKVYIMNGRELFVMGGGGGIQEVICARGNCFIFGFQLYIFLCLLTKIDVRVRCFRLLSF